MTKQKKSQARKIPSYVQDAIAARNLESIRASTVNEQSESDPISEIDLEPTQAITTESILNNATSGVQVPPMRMAEDSDSLVTETPQPSIDASLTDQTPQDAESIGEPEAPSPDPTNTQAEIEDFTLFESNEEINDEMRQAGMSEAQISMIYSLANRHLQPAWGTLVRNLSDMIRVERDEERLVTSFGNQEKWQRAQEKILTWGEANVPKEALENLASSYDGVMALYRLMQPGSNLHSRGTTQTPSDNIDSLKLQMRDPRYWRDHDPDYRHYVSQGFERLFPDSENS